MNAPMLGLSAPKQLELLPFQRRVVTAMETILADGALQPILLRSPTASGKTLMIVKALEAVCRKRKIVWFWFAPFATLVDQTARTINDYGKGLTAALLASQRASSGYASGLIYISTAQAVASGEANIHEGSDDLPSLQALITNIRAEGLQIGIVVDEAHIGLDGTTRFGQVCHNMINPDFLTCLSRSLKTILDLRFSSLSLLG